MREGIGVLVILLILFAPAVAGYYYDDFSGSSLNSSFWSVTVSGGASVKVANGYLNLTGVRNTKASAEVDSIQLNTSQKLVIEFSLKTDIQGTGKASYGANRDWGLKDGLGNVIFQFKADQNGFVLRYGNKTVIHSFSGVSLAQNFATYKYVIENGRALIYLNNELVGNISIKSNTVKVYFHVNTWDGGENKQANILVDWIRVENLANVKFRVINGLTGQGLSNVSIYENGSQIATVSDGQTLELAIGKHVLTFKKDGYWSVTETIDVKGDMGVSVELYPTSAAFKFEGFPANISIPENTIYKLTFTITPISTSATYNTYLAISGVDVVKVLKGSSEVSPENGRYYLGDISGPTQVSIEFKSGSVGTHGFTIVLTSNDAALSKTYTTSKTVVYKVTPLPFTVQMPSEWQVGTNELRISESSGQSYLMTVSLKNSSGSIVWSDSYDFGPYAAHVFEVKVPKEGSYTLELQWNGQTAVYDITVNPAITLKTKTLTVSKGGEGTIVLHFKNPSNNVQYYTIKLSGGFLPKAINQSIAVAPLSEKDVSVAFAVPDDLQYDAYELNVQVLQGNATVFTDKVAVTIDDSGFSLFGGVSSSSKMLYYGLAALIGLGLFIAVLRRR